MKKFIKKMVALCAIVVVFLIVLFVKSNSEPYRSILARITNAEEYDRESAEEILPYIDQAKTGESKYTKLIIGDSVCHQIFNSFQKYNDVYNTLGSNQAITMAGQYLLAKEFIVSHSEVTDIILILRNLNSGINLEGYTYQYFVIPFTEADLMNEIITRTKIDLEEIYGSFWMKPEVVSFVDYSPIAKKIYLNSLSVNNYDGMQLSFDYLSLIIDMCEQRDISFHLLHAPMPETTKTVMEEQFERVYAACTDEKLRPYIEQFYETVTYYPDEYFSDGIHFGIEYSDGENLKTYIMGLMDKNSDLADFKMY